MIDQVHAAGKPFLLHSCGKIFRVMDDLIGLGIDAKHSNEDAIAPFDEWITRYGDRIGLLGGIDVDILCQQSPQDIVKDVVERGGRFRRQAKATPLAQATRSPTTCRSRVSWRGRSCPGNLPQGERLPLQYSDCRGGEGYIASGVRGASRSWRPSVEARSVWEGGFTINRELPPGPHRDPSIISSHPFRVFRYGSAASSTSEGI